MTDVADFPCCEHCEPDCWSQTVGHGCSCLKCEPRVIPSGQGHLSTHINDAYSGDM